jgi:hypothetical protein
MLFSQPKNERFSMFPVFETETLSAPYARQTDSLGGWPQFLGTTGPMVSSQPERPTEPFSMLPVFETETLSAPYARQADSLGGWPQFLGTTGPIVSSQPERPTNEPFSMLPVFETETLSAISNIPYPQQTDFLGGWPQFLGTAGPMVSSQPERPTNEPFSMLPVFETETLSAISNIPYPQHADSVGGWPQFVGTTVGPMVSSQPERPTNEPFSMLPVPETETLSAISNPLLSPLSWMGSHRYNYLRVGSVSVITFVDFPSIKIFLEH